MTDQMTPDGDAGKATLNRRLEDIAWGLFLMLIGFIWLVPKDTLPHGSWLIGPGLILLGLNLARYLNGLKVNWFSTVLGLGAVAAGFGSVFAVDLPILAIMLILIGAQIIVRPLITKTVS